MRRNIAMISAALTTFSVVVLASVIYAYQTMAAPATNPSTAAVAPGSAEVAAVSAPSDAAASQNVSPQDAAALAATFMNRSDAFSVEVSNFNGAQCYKVTFGSGDIAYVALNGQVLGQVLAKSSTAAAPMSSVPVKKHATGSGRPSRGGGGAGAAGGGDDGGGGDGGGEGGGGG